MTTIMALCGGRVCARVCVLVVTRVGRSHEEISPSSLRQIL